jgi:hypothetical protein
MNISASCLTIWTKPRLRRCGHVWLCVLGSTTGIGATPAEAYAHWCSQRWFWPQNIPGTPLFEPLVPAPPAFPSPVYPGWPYEVTCGGSA